MLNPDYLLRISEGSEEIASQLHNDIIKRIVNRIMLRIGRGEKYLLTSKDQWQILTLQQAGYLIEDIQKDIAKATKLQQSEIAEAMEEAGVKAIDYDDSIYRATGLSPAPLKQSPELIRLMQRNYDATMGEWTNFTRTMADEAQKMFLNQLDNAYTLVSTGALSYTQAVREVINNIVSDGVTVTYPSGHSDTIETATLRAVRTGISQASAQIQIARMEEMDCGNVIVSSHLGARPSHQVWQGKVFTIEELRSTNEGMPAYGTVGGLCGANCRHNFSPWFEGMDNPFDHYDSEENRKQYEKEQYQRTLERRIRKTKREVMAKKEAVDTCKDDKLKFELDMDYQKKAELLSKQNKAYQEYCENNNLRPLSERLQIAKWDRKQAASARGAARRYENAHGVIEISKKIDIEANIGKYESEIEQIQKDYKKATLEAMSNFSPEGMKKAQDLKKKLDSVKSEYEKFKIDNASAIEALKQKKEVVSVDKRFEKISSVKEVKGKLKEIGFKDISDRIDVLNAEMMVDSTNQFAVLEKKFGAVRNGNVYIDVTNHIKQKASVCTFNGDSSTQVFNFTRYFKKSKQEIIESLRNEIMDGFKMPVLSKNYSVYTVTHEYGHILENNILADLFKKLPNETKKEYNIDGLKLKIWRSDQANNIRKEIVDIARELSDEPQFMSYDYISGYGKTNCYEFFAEVFANSQLGQPNVLGDAMNIWLERKGLIKNDIG